MGPHEQSSPHPGDDERARDARSVRLSSTVFAALETHLGSQQVSRVIYGAILGLALTLGLERHPPGAGVVVATLFATAIAVGLAEIYSEVVGTETRTRNRI